MVDKTIDEIVNEVKKNIAELRASEKINYLMKIIRACGNPELIRKLLPLAEELQLDNEDVVEVKIEEPKLVKGGLEKVLEKDNAPKKVEKRVISPYLQKDENIPIDYMSKTIEKTEVQKMDISYLEKEDEVKSSYFDKRQSIISNDSYSIKKLEKEVKYRR